MASFYIHQQEGITVCGVTIKDREGNEHPLELGALVYNRHLVGRVSYIRRSNGVSVTRVANESVAYVNPGELILLSNEPPISKGDSCLATRYYNLRNNIRDASRVQQYGRARLILERIAEILFEPNTWFWHTVTESLDDPRLVSYAADPEYSDNDQRRKKCAWGKFLRSVAPKHGFTLTEEEILIVCNAIGQSFPTDNTYSFEEVTGRDAIVSAYGEEQPGKWGSCMYHTEYVGWYGDTPEKCAVLKIYRGGIYCGRAVLWTTDQGVRFLDRIYPSDGGDQVRAAESYAGNKGWLCMSNCPDGEFHNLTVTMKRSSNGLYPYCDTFRYTDHSPSDSPLLVMGTISGSYVLCETDGTFYGGEEEDNHILCCSCGDHSGDEGSIVIREEFYCQSCVDDEFTYVDYTLNGRYIHGYYPNDEVQLCEHCGELRLLLHCAEVTLFCGNQAESEPQYWCHGCTIDDASPCEHCNELIRDLDMTSIEKSGYEIFLCPPCAESAKMAKAYTSLEDSAEMAVA